MILPIDKSDAILALRPNAQFRLQGDVLTWTDPEQTEPTSEEIQTIQQICNVSTQIFQRWVRFFFPHNRDDTKE